MMEMADVAEKYSGGEVRVTCEENLVFPNVKNADIEAMSKEPFFQRFEINAGMLTGSLVSCTGSQFCGFAMIETKNRCASPLAIVKRLLVTGCLHLVGARVMLTAQCLHDCSIQLTLSTTGASEPRRHGLQS